MAKDLPVIQTLALLILAAIISLNQYCSLSSYVAAGATDSTNLLENGSFENINGYNYTPNNGLTNDAILSANYWTPDGPTNAIAYWLLTNGTIDWANRRWPRASDCSDMCIDITGSDPGTVQTNFSAKLETSYTVILDAAPNFDAPTPGLIGYFSVLIKDLRRGLTLNSYNASVDGVNNPGWHSYGFGFNTSSINYNSTAVPEISSTGYLDLTLIVTTNTTGYWGPLIDNIRVYEAVFDSPIDSGKVITCPDDLPKDQKVKIVASSVSCIVALLLCIGLLIWRKNMISKARDKKVTSHLEGILRIIPYKVIKSATEGFNDSLKLGQGTFGVVYKGTLGNEDEVAIKKLFAESPQGQKEFLEEALVISNVQHRNLVKLKGCSVKGFQTYLVYEYVENNSLDQVLWGNDHVPLNWRTRYKIILGIARGLAYLHDGCQPRIIHRDIKASNVLIDKNFEAKIADFGLAKLLPDDKTHVSTQIAGTLGYLAPEYAMRGQLSEKADVFSFGILVLELVSGRKNLDRKLPLEIEYILDWVRQLESQGKLEEVIDLQLGFNNSNLKEQVIEVIEIGLMCTHEVSVMRPTMQEVIEMLQRLRNYSLEKACDGNLGPYVDGHKDKSSITLIREEDNLSTHSSLPLLNQSTPTSFSISSSDMPSFV